MSVKKLKKLKNYKLLINYFLWFSRTFNVTKYKHIMSIRIEKIINYKILL